MPLSACLHIHRPVMKSVVKTCLHHNVYHIINTLHTCPYPGLPVAFHLDSDLVTNSPCWERRAWKSQRMSINHKVQLSNTQGFIKIIWQIRFPHFIALHWTYLGNRLLSGRQNCWESLGVILINLLSLHCLPYQIFFFSPSNEYMALAIRKWEKEARKSQGRNTPTILLLEIRDLVFLPESQPSLHNIALLRSRS